MKHRRFTNRGWPAGARISAALAFATLVCAAAPADAASFFGTRRNDNITPNSFTDRCAPMPTVNVGPGFSSYAEGTSNFGAFTIVQSHCQMGPPPGPILDGQFEYTFETGDTLTGTFMGATSATGTPTLFNIVNMFIITGGTGRFVNARGGFELIGTVDLSSGRPMAEGAFQGVLTVPEPAAWAMMIAGFGAVGGAMRRRRGQFVTA